MDRKLRPLSNILSCATDGTPSMAGRSHGFLAFLKEAVPNIVAEMGPWWVIKYRISPDPPLNACLVRLFGNRTLHVCREV